MKIISAPPKMNEAFVDTDVLIRLLTKDDPRKQAAAAALFEEVEAGRLKLAAPDTVIADAVFVLSSPRLYNLTRSKVAGLLIPLLRLPGFHVANRRAVVRALELFATTKLDFGDTMLVASMEEAGSRTLYSYDTDFDRVPGVERKEPGSDTTGAE